MVKTILNLLWLFLGGGLGLGLYWLLAGVILCITVIGIPFGVAAFRLANYVFWPFGRDLVPAERVGGSHGGSLVTIANILWFVLSGIWLAIGHCLVGVSLFMTIIGIPFAIAHFKIAAAALFPLGKRIVEVG
ncbi:MAG: YccF domain-containing protein [Planctomycetota bacterium]|jgi:uncharacterized membrane protein YccF (DUF307 family)